MQWSTAISNTPSNWPTCRRSTSCRTSTSKRLSGFRRVSDVQKGRQQFFAFGYGGGFGVLFCGNLWYLILYWILYLLISSIKEGISTLGFLVSYIYIIIYIYMYRLYPQSYGPSNSPRNFQALALEDDEQPLGLRSSAVRDWSRGCHG